MRKETGNVPSLRGRSPKQSRNICSLDCFAPLAMTGCNNLKRTHLLPFILLLLLCFFASTGHAQEIYNLKRCLEIALEKNYDIRMVRNDNR